MRPNYPYQSDPNAAYRRAIASLGDIPNVDHDGAEAGPSNYQDVPHEGLAARGNRQRLNAIAHHLGRGVNAALAMMGTESLHYQSGHQVGQSAEASTSQHENDVSILNSIRELLAGQGVTLRRPLTDDAILYRLQACRLSPRTLLDAVRIVNNPNHPVMQSLRASTAERHVILKDLSAFLNSNHLARQKLEIAHESGNDAACLIAGLHGSY